MLKNLALSLTLGLGAFGLSTATAQAPSKDTPQAIIYAQNRIGFGVSPTEFTRIQAVGLPAWIDSQLKGNLQEPQELVDALTLHKPKPTEQLTEEFSRAQKAKDQKTIQTMQRELLGDTFANSALRAIYSPNQLHERMNWFWFNHFNVAANKGLNRGQAWHYENEVIRPHALGNFKQLLLATLKSPSMLVYLDNFKNSTPDASGSPMKNERLKSRGFGGINENYARELLELHTLGQDGGYTQKDVQELARILTGFTIKRDNTPLKTQSEYQSLVVSDGLFVFDPERHDFGSKVFMGRPIQGKGYFEIEEVLTILVSHPSTARHISKKIATHFVSDTPSEALVKKMQATFLKTNGDIKAVLKTMFDDPDFWNQKNTPKFKMPHEFVYSMMRITHDTRIIKNIKPLFSQMDSLGQRPYGKQTPDGYGLQSKDWESADQIGKRLALASQFGEKKLPVSFDVAYRILAPMLSENTKDVLQKSPANERLGYLLASPEFVNK